MIVRRRKGANTFNLAASSGNSAVGGHYEIILEVDMKHTKRTAGRLGGLKTLERHGRDHMQAIGRRGAQVFWQRYHLVPCELSDFAIVERATGRVVNLLYRSW